jgi:hypothetical protein
MRRSPAIADAVWGDPAHYQPSPVDQVASPESARRLHHAEQRESIRKSQQRKRDIHSPGKKDATDEN